MALRIACVFAAVLSLIGSLERLPVARQLRSAAKRRVITMWHQVRPAEREVLRDEIARLRGRRTPTSVSARSTRKPKSCAAAFRRRRSPAPGPELVYGPSDVLDTFHTMGLIQDLTPWFPTNERDEFVDGALTYLPVAHRTQRSASWCKSATASAITWRWSTTATSSRSRPRRPTSWCSSPSRTRSTKTATAAGTATAWSGISPSRSSSIPFLTGYGGWVFEEPESTPPDARRSTRPQSIAAYALHPVAPRRAPGRARQLRLRARRLAVQDRPGRDDHQRRLELGRLPREPGDRRRRRRAADRERRPG